MCVFKNDKAPARCHNHHTIQSNKCVFYNNFNCILERSYQRNRRRLRVLCGQTPDHTTVDSIKDTSSVSLTVTFLWWGMDAYLQSMYLVWTRITNYGLSVVIVFLGI